MFYLICSLRFFIGGWLKRLSVKDYLGNAKCSNSPESADIYAKMGGAYNCVKCFGLSFSNDLDSVCWSAIK